MKTKNYFLLILILCSVFVQGQNFINNNSFHDDCNTADVSETEMQSLPWFSNSEYLNDYRIRKEQEMGLEGRSLTSPVLIPIVIHMLADGSNDGNIPNALAIDAAFREINTRFSNNSTYMQFYLKCINVVPVSDDEGIGYLAISVLNDLLNDNKAINFFVHNNNNGLGNATVLLNKPFIYVRRSRWDFREDFNGVNINDPNGEMAGIASFQTLTHELGHYFGLAHTHAHSWNPLLSENVSRNWTFLWNFPLLRIKHCSITGDLLCDTPADPNMSSDDDPGNLDGDFVGSMNPDQDLFTAWPTPSIMPDGSRYIGNLFGVGDDFNFPFSPDERNIMAYANRPLRTNFTREQVAVMWHKLDKRIDQGLEVSSPNTLNSALPDQYEIDDDARLATEISNGEIQRHNFHQTSCGTDAIDWISINTASSLPLTFRIYQPQSQTIPVDETMLRVFESIDGGTTLTDITSSFVINAPNDREILIDINCGVGVSGQIWLMLLPKTGTLVTRLYDVQYGISNAVMNINAPLQACIGDEISISNLPPNALVNWSSASLILSSTNSPNTSIIGTIGDFSDNTLSAIVEVNGCSVTLIHSFEEIAPDLENVGQIQVSIDNSNVCRPTYTFSIADAGSGSNYEWDCGGSIGFNGCSSTSDPSVVTAQLNFHEATWLGFGVNVTISNDCGQEIQRFYSTTVTGTSSCFNGSPPRTIEISPNPVGETFNVIITENEFLEQEVNYSIYVTTPLGATEHLGESPLKELNYSTNNFINGLHHLHVIVDQNITTESFIVQK